MDGFDDGLKNALQVKPLDLICKPCPAARNTAMGRLQRLLVLPVVASLLSGMALYLYSFVVTCFLGFIVPSSVLHMVNECMLQIAAVCVLLPLVALPVVAPVLLFSFWQQCAATHIRLCKDGFAFWGKIAGVQLSTPAISWSALLKAFSVEGAEKEQALEFGLRKDSGFLLTGLAFWLLCPAIIKGLPGLQTWRLQIPLSAFPFELDFERLMLVLKAVLPQEAQYDLSGLSTRLAGAGYTELWLDGLSPDTHSGVMQDGMCLAGGKYVIDQVIGSGGEGVVYKAVQRESKDGEAVTVAIKEFVLPIHGGYTCAARALEHIQKEKDLLQHLNHPGIIKLLDCFVEDNRVYLALELLAGKSIRDLVQENGPLSESRVIEIAEQMCGILQYLHWQQPAIIHRDFAPDNLMLLEDGSIKLIDFNVAQQLEANATQTIVGRHAYVPPEQFRGKATTQSDLYALGATMYFMLTGQDPEPITVAHPKTAVYGVSDELDALVAELTQPELSRRFEKIELVQQALHAVEKPAIIFESDRRKLG